MGTPEFATGTLKALIGEGCNIVGVITAPDKPAGRGKKLQEPDVKKFAVQQGLLVLQPDKLKNPDFLQQLRGLKADLQIVVAFRMLPEEVWGMPAKGTLNLHGSLLPQYRGAAPINWALINGEQKTGVTTFLIEKDIDTGKIIFQEEVTITRDMNAGGLHDLLMDTGAKLVIKTVRAIAEGNYPQVDQSSLFAEAMALKPAPKIFKEDCKINWNNPAVIVHNFIRGLSPYPTAHTAIKTNEGAELSLKIFEAIPEVVLHQLAPGTILSDGKKYLKFAVADGFILVLSLQLEGRKRLVTEEFLRGFGALG
jgi:methionyl-tRNA formyltransferase